MPGGAHTHLDVEAVKDESGFGGVGWGLSEVPNPAKSVTSTSSPADWRLGLFQHAVLHGGIQGVLNQQLDSGHHHSLSSDGIRGGSPLCPS